MLLSQEMPRFTFPPVSSLEQLGVLFKVDLEEMNITKHKHFELKD